MCNLHAQSQTSNLTGRGNRKIEQLPSIMYLLKINPLKKEIYVTILIGFKFFLDKIITAKLYYHAPYYNTTFIFDTVST